MTFEAKSLNHLRNSYQYLQQLIKELAMLDYEQNMRAIVAPQPGGPEVLEVQMRAIPTPGDREVLIKVAAAGVNGADLREREGKYPVPAGAPDLMGLEVSGEIVEVGLNCDRFKIGDRVCALLIGGGYAEYAIAPEGQCMTIPENISLIDAAGIPEVFCTVWTNMMDRCQLAKGEKILIQGGTSGIGHAAISIAKANGAIVFSTARTSQKCDAIVRFGADHAINYQDEDVFEVCKQLTGGYGVDVIIDIIGGEYLPKEVELLAHNGRLMILNLRGGKFANVDFSHVHAKHLTITGARLRPRSIKEKSDICRSLEEKVWPLFKNKVITTETYMRLPFNEANKAHEIMEASNHIGKILLTPPN